MIRYRRDYHGNECPKCGTTAPWQVQHYRRPARWNATAASMNNWEAEYCGQFATEHEAPETGLLEWLIWHCRCGYAFETECADA